MKGTEKIIAHIMADAQAKADAIISEAAKQCEAITAAYEQKAKEAYGEKIRAGVKLCQDRMDGTERINQMEKRKAVLALKQEMVSESFIKAREQLVALPDERYIELLAKLASQAAVTGEEEIVLNARDREKVGAAVVEAANARLEGGRLTLSESVGDFAGGLILRRGNIEANCTAELLVELCRGDMSAQIADVLFS